MVCNGKFKYPQRQRELYKTVIRTQLQQLLAFYCFCLVKFLKTVF